MPTVQGKHASELSKISLSCNSLSVDPLFAEMMQHYCSDGLIALRQLSVHAAGHHVFAERQLEGLPDFSQASSLKSVQLTSCGPINIFTAKCPEGLQTLRLCHEGPLGEVTGLAEKLQYLTSLELNRCIVHLPAETFLSFGRLQSLSLVRSEVISLGGDITVLTNLVTLDLRNSRWGRRRMHLRDVADPALKSFVAWPALQVLKITGSTLIDRSTMLRVASVSEVHTHFMAASLEGVKVHLFESVSGRSGCSHYASLNLVELQLKFRFSKAVSQLSFLVDELLQSSALRILSVDTRYDSNTQFPQPVCSKASQLKEPTLHGVCCKSIDLSSSCLSSVSLSNIEPGDCQCTILLPTTLESFVFHGHSLFCPGSEMCFQHLTALSHITLCHRPTDVNKTMTALPPVLVPIFPQSLRHLRILNLEVWQLLDKHAQRALSTCSNLERLTLPYDCHISGRCRIQKEPFIEFPDLESPMTLNDPPDYAPSYTTTLNLNFSNINAWIRAARHVHVVGCVATRLGSC